MLRDSLYRRVIAIALGAAALVAVGVGFFGELYFRSNLRAEKERTFAEVESRVDLLDQVLNAAEGAMLARGRRALEEIAREYDDAGGPERLARADLDDLAHRLGVGDLYIVDPRGKIASTSLSVDKGLDLSKFGKSFTSFLDEVRGKGRIFDESLTVSGRTGDIKTYQYFSPRGSSWIIEASSDLVDWFPAFGAGLSYADFIGLLFKPFVGGKTTAQPLLSFDIIRWSQAGSWSLIRPGTKRYLDKTTVSGVLAKGETIIHQGDREYHYRTLEWKGTNPGFSDPRVVELVVDLSPLDGFARNMLLVAVLACLLAGLLAYAAAKSFFERSFLGRVEALQGAIKRVAAGERGVAFDSNGEDELSFIGESIEAMIEDFHASEENLRNARAAETVGIMAGGLAHDINNLLAGAIGAASILRNRLEEEGSVPKEELASSLALIERTGEKGSALVRDLLALARIDRPPPSPVDLRLLVGEVVDLMRVSAPASVRLDLSLPAVPAEVLGSAEDLERVLMNLCRNGIQSMTDMRPPEAKRGGLLQVSLAARAGEEGLKPEWAVSIRDHGVGMSPETQARLFTPFFSTKTRRGGSGLGLSASRAIAEAHGGHIEVESLLGSGSTFTLVLPLARGPFQNEDC